jgi:two-component system LytT family response regulator
MTNIKYCNGYPFCLQYNKKERSDKIFVKHNKNDHIVQCREIVFCKSEKQYTWLYLADNTRLLASRSLGVFEQLLPDCFFRIHHDTLLNLHFIKTILKLKNSVAITLTNGVCLNTSCRKKKAFFDKLKSQNNNPL